MKRYTQILSPFHLISADSYEITAKGFILLEILLTSFIGEKDIYRLNQRQ